MSQPGLSNTRDFLGWLIGRKVVDITAGDPASVPDSDPSDEWDLVLHFDNGGTLAVPTSEDGFHYYNPDEVDAEKVKQLWLARDFEAIRKLLPPRTLWETPTNSSGPECSELLMPSKTGEMIPMRADRDMPSTVRHPLGVGVFGVGEPITLDRQTVTVRSWFRQMRAADFARDSAKATSTEGGFFWKVHPDLQGWTLFDTQRVIDRETRPHYERLEYAGFEVFGARVYYADSVEETELRWGR